MMTSRRGLKAEIRRLSGAAVDAMEHERAHRAGLSRRGRRLARSGKAVGLIAMTGIVLLALVRQRHDRDDNEATARGDPEKLGRGRRTKGRRENDRILGLARLAVTTSRFWELANDRR